MALPDSTLWATFVLAASLLVLTPGPDMAYVATALRRLAALFFVGVRLALAERP